MPLSRLENFLKNAEGNILYVSPSDFDATDSFENQGNSLTRPFKTIQRALIEAARFSYQNGRNNDKIDRTTILVYPGTHYIDNRPGYSITQSGINAVYRKRTGSTTWTPTTLDEFGVNTNYNILDTNNDLYKFNSINGGVILPRGTSIIGYDLRKTKIRPLYVPNPEDTTVENSSIFNVTGTCYFSIFTFLDGDPTKTVFRDYTNDRFVPNYSHHKLVSFAYADGVNKVVLGGTEQTDLTDLDMYYYKVARAYGDLTGRNVVDYPSNNDFEPSTDEYRIVGSLQANPIGILSIFGGNGVSNPKNLITVTTKDFLTGDEKPHGLSVDSPVLISGVTADAEAFNGSFTVKEIVGLTTFTYTSTAAPANANPDESAYESGIVTIESDTVNSASPYVFNCSIRSVYGLCGMWADGSKADGFKSMVVAQFTGVSLQKDDNAFLIYENGSYQSNISLDVNSTQRPLHINGNAIYKPDYENTHIRVSNNGFVQSVSIFAIGFAKHFLTESGGDMSITNSNSNFGAISLESTGFRDESFDRDDVGYITHIIPPKEIDDIESEVNWLSLDVPKTISVGNTSKLYLFNYKSPDIKPANQIDGYRIGARTNDLLNLTVVVGTSQTTYTSPILMPVPSGTSISAKKIYTVSRIGSQNNISNNIFTLNTNHQLYNGESVRIFSDTSQAPDGIDLDTVYYAITAEFGANQFRLAYSLNDAIAHQPITGINNNGGILTVVSSVTDKLPNDLGHPIQYDKSQSQWYITGSETTATNKIYNTIVGFGTIVLGNETAATFVKRKSDTRSIEDRIYKVRYVIPKEFENARPPQGGFVLQESKTVGVSTISFDNTYTLTGSTPPTYLRNEKIISDATVGAVSNGSQIVTATTELPHKFIVGDKVKVQKIKSTNNPLGTGLTSTYNGSYQVLSVPSTKQFTYRISGVKINPGTYTNLINERDTRQEREQLPLVSREQYSGNYFIYRVNTIKTHVPGAQGQDGIYNLIVLASNVSPNPLVGFGISQKSFNQDVRNLYPQIDRDNFNIDPTEAISFADIKTLGKVITGDKKKSVTKETINNFIKNTRIGFGITGISTSGIAGTTITVFTDVEHTLNSLKRVSISAAGAGYGNTTIYASNLTGGSGTNGSVRANLSSGTVQSVSIVDPGSAYGVGNTLTISGPPGITPSVNSTLSVAEINNNVGDGIQLSGFNQTDLNGVYKILSVPSSKSFIIFNPAGLSAYTQNTNGRVPTAVLSSKGVGITSFRFDTVLTGIVTVTTSTAHGLLPGNKFTIVESGQTIYDNSFFVKDNVGLNTFTFYVGIVTQTKASTKGTLLKSTISANALNLTRGEENLGSRASYIYAGITTTLTTTLTTSSSTVGLSSAAGFNRGDYVIINAEIVRLASSPTGNTFTILRGQFSTFKTSAEVGTQVKKIVVLPMELRRPSFMRASSHTFEYVGYGPGNYSTAIPQKQTRTLTEDDILTSQAREQAGGTVVYTGTNDLGEFYSGTKKLSSSTGEEKVIDAPILTFTGDDALGENQNRSSGIFDDVIVKERFTVEGGDDGNQSSQFYGPVNFTNKVTNTAEGGINTKNLFIKGNTSQNKLITVGISTPTSSNFTSYNPGDISLKSNPTDGYIGQVYVNDRWKRFGLISDSVDILDIKVDRLGIGDISVFSGVGGVGNAKLYVAGNTKLENVTITGSTVFTSNVVLNDVNFNDVNIRRTAKFSGIGGTSYAIYVYSEGDLVNGEIVPALTSRLYDLEVANNAYISGNLGIGTTNPGTKLNVSGDIRLSAPDPEIEFNINGPRLKSSSPNTLTIHTGGGLNTINNEAVRINTTGVGIGTANPINKLDVIGNSYISGNLGIGTINPTSKLVVNGTIGIDASSSTAGRTQLAASASGFFVNHNDNSPIIFQTQSVERLRIGAGGTVTATANNSLTETRGSHLRITNLGNGGDSVISWDNNLSGTNKQRWYAGIDVSDSYAWKLARPIPTNFDDENFDRPSSGGNLAETKLKIDVSGNATFLGNLTSISGSLTLNTNKFTVAGATGNTVIAGSTSIAGTLDVNSNLSLSVSGFNKFSADTNGNVANSGTLTSSGKLKTLQDLEVTTSATVGSTLGVIGQITAASFKVKDATNELLLLRATGNAKALTKTELDIAANFVIQPPVTNSTLPNGNSIQLLSLNFDGFTRTFQLKKLDNTLLTPVSAEDLIVSVGGIVRRPNTDYTISTSNITFPASAWTTPPAAGTSHFIIALGGLGGGLTRNLDWDGAKGTLLVGTSNDNEGIKLNVGSNAQVLTADSNAQYGIAWKDIPRDNLKTNPAWDGKGDLLVGTGPDTAEKFSVGSNDQILTVDSSTTSGLSWKSPAIQAPSVPSGSVMLFYQANAPTGWTKVTTQDNKALRVVSGNGGVTGGSTPFTSVFTSRSVGGSVSGGSVSVSVSGNTGGRSLSESQLASHDHGFRPNNGSFKSLFMSVTRSGGDTISGLTPLPQNAFSDSETASVTRGFINNAGSNFSHDHSFSGSGSGSLSGASFGTTLDFAVQYIDVIIASKN